MSVPLPLLPALLLLASPAPPGPAPCVSAPCVPVQYVIETPSGGSVLQGPGMVPPVSGGLVGPPTVMAPTLPPPGPPVLPSVGVAGSSLPAPGTMAPGATAPAAVVPMPQFRRR